MIHCPVCNLEEPQIHLHYWNGGNLYCGSCLDKEIESFKNMKFICQECKLKIDYEDTLSLCRDCGKMAHTICMPNGNFEGKRCRLCFWWRFDWRKKWTYPPNLKLVREIYDEDGYLLRLP